MKLQNQVTSLDLSKQLKELGVKQESLFHWELDEDENSRIVYDPKPTRDYDFSAFTVAELGEMLPWKIEKSWIAPNKTEIKDWYLDIFKHDFERRVGNHDKWNVTYSSNQLTYIHMAGQTESNARAKMLIYLLENKLITL